MRFVAALAGAGLYALALPPIDLAPLAWLAVTPLLLAVRGQPITRGFAYGLAFGCGCGWAFTWWAAPAIASYFGMPLWAACLAATAVYVAVSVPTFGVFGAAVTRLWRDDAPIATCLSVPALWVAAELVRGRLVEQPWGLIGYTQHAHVELIQFASFGGVYAVSYLVVLTGTAVAVAARHAARGESRAARRAGLALAVVLLCWWISGVALTRSTALGGFTPRRVAVIQTNVAPQYRWTRAYTERQLSAHLAATERIAGDPALIVWPENAVPRYLEMEPILATELADLATRRRADLVIGGPRLSDDGVRNSVRLITAAGRNGGHYDKQHLVAFAEDRPLGSGPVDPDSPSEFTAGRTPGVLPSFVKLGVSICHEIVYPELVHRAVGDGAELLVNVSNDGWLDGRSGVASRQHFAMSVFRAVEARRYLVRGAITGVSGIVDPRGRVVSLLGSNRSGVLTAEVAGRHEITPYVRFGDAFAVGCAIVSLAALARRRLHVPVWVARRVPAADAT